MSPIVLPKERNVSTAFKKAVRTSSVALKFLTIPILEFFVVPKAER